MQSRNIIASLPPTHRATGILLESQLPSNNPLTKLLKHNSRFDHPEKHSYDTLDVYLLFSVKASRAVCALDLRPLSSVEPREFFHLLSCVQS